MIEIVNQHHAFELSQADEVLMRQAIETTIEVEDFNYPYDVSLIIVDKATIQQYNRDYRAKDKPTDVLSFIQYDDEGFVYNENEPIFLGDIVLCYDIALEQAEQFGHSTVREIAYLICHSTLHLLGYDHEEADQKQEMRQREKLIMTKLNANR